MNSSKIAFAFILSLLFTSNSFSQSTSDLDAKKGFKDFTLGDTYSKWSSYLKNTNIADDNIKYYDYTGTCCMKVFTYDLEKIRLGFKDDKLQVIYLITKKQSDANWLSDQYKSLKSSFTLLYGKPYAQAPNDNSGNIVSGWAGKSVILTLEYEYLGVQRDGVNVYTASRCNILVGSTTDIKSGF